jgi:hypothetical protein
MQAKMQANGFPPKWEIPQVVGITGMAGVAQLVELWIVIPMPPSNISDLAPKSMQTNADKALECRQNADKMRTLDLLPSAHPTTLTYPNKYKQL